MTRSDLIRTVAERCGVPRALADRAVRVVFDRMASALREGRRVELRGFGVFEVRRRAARVGSDPRTGVPVAVPSRRHPHFHAGKALRARIQTGAP
ncbi:MAG: integration host factor subunit beta [Deltaproteobacteria bacterium]|nr:integration host factor subunit beta [Deltaproteobacteria bacterium]